MKRVLFFLTGLVVAGIALTWWFTGRGDDAPIPDEKRVAMMALEDLQSGPGYFHAEADTPPDDQGVRWTTPDKAAAQIDRVLRERKLEEAGRAKLEKLINEVSEPHPSRTIGGSRVNLARLNVALDANVDAR